MTLRFLHLHLSELAAEHVIASDKLEVQKNIGMTLRCCIRMNLRREPSLRTARNEAGSNLNLLFNQLKDDKDCFAALAMTAPGSTAKG